MRHAVLVVALVAGTAALADEAPPSDAPPAATPPAVTPPAVTPQQEASARELYKAGGDAYARGRYDVAIEAFEAALALLENEPLLYSAAQAHRLQFFATEDVHHLERAVALYRSYLAVAPAGAGRDHATQHLAVLLPMLERVRASELSADAPVDVKAKLIVTSETPGARASIDDGEPREIPATFEVEPGPHEVVVEAADHLPARQRTVAVAGAPLAMNLALEPTPATLVVNASAGADVLVDGAALRSTSVCPGRHDVVVLAHGREPFVREVELAPGESRTLDVELPLTAQTWLGYGASALGGALLLSAAVPGTMAALRDFDTLAIEEELAVRPLSPSEVDRYHALGEERDAWWAGAAGLSVGAAAMAGLGVGLLLFDDAVSRQE